MTAHPTSPIYDQLVEEQGDVLTETRKLAEQTQEQASQVLDWTADA
ncbi:MULTISPECIES: hypothetical protein [Streptomyces]|uniref:WXG100 family type VII secretion target n=1 Tax=Streptomyces lichenis TaxID=2306967 RepID=A0ABT0IBG2_9ACTN|nr:hypothetical protein [Streptomyces lichenis]MCK8678667.1 hypothetical protein [Streptomyces lichenis]